MNRKIEQIYNCKDISFLPNKAFYGYSVKINSKNYYFCVYCDLNKSNNEKELFIIDCMEHQANKAIEYLIHLGAPPKNMIKIDEFSFIENDANVISESLKKIDVKIKIFNILKNRNRRLDEIDRNYNIGGVNYGIY